MSPTELFKIAEALVVITGLAAIVFAVFRDNTTKRTIAAQKDLITALDGQIKELRILHSDNQASIAKLSGQVTAYKEIPLADLAKSMADLSTTQKKILKALKTPQSK